MEVCAQGFCKGDLGRCGQEGRGDRESSQVESSVSTIPVNVQAAGTPQGRFFKRWDSLREKALTLDPTPRLRIFDYDADRDRAELEKIRKRIVEEVSPRISGFGPQHIRCQERATQVHASDIL